MPDFKDALLRAMQDQPDLPGVLSMAMSDSDITAAEIDHYLDHDFAYTDEVLEGSRRFTIEEAALLAPQMGMFGPAILEATEELAALEKVPDYAQELLGDFIDALEDVAQDGLEQGCGYIARLALGLETQETANG